MRTHALSTLAFRRSTPANSAVRAITAGALALCTALSLSACSSASTDPSGETTAPEATGASDSSPQLQIFAASSTRVLNEDLEAAAGIPLAFNNGGSSSLVHSINEGAPADLLLTASAATMDMAVANGDVETPRTLATNTMVMVVPRGNPAGLRSIHDITEDTHFVLCDPQVPCGDISEQIMEAEGLEVAPDSLENQVADVLGKVASGEADAGWVYSTDAAASEDVEVIEIAGAERFRNEIRGAVVRTSPNHDRAEEVLELLATDFDDSWRAHGFSPAD